MNTLCTNEHIERLIEGDQLVFKMIYDHYSQRIFRYAFNFVKDEAWAEEIVQDTFLKLWNARLGLDPAGDIWLYLYVLCKRLCLSRLREINRTKSLQERFLMTIENIDTQQEENVVTRDLESFITRVVEHLPYRQKEIFRLSRYEGFTHKEIAEKLNISVNTVKNHMVLALKEIRLSLDKSDYTYFIILTFSVLSV